MAFPFDSQSFSASGLIILEFSLTSHSLLQQRTPSLTLHLSFVNFEIPHVSYRHVHLLLRLRLRVTSNLPLNLPSLILGGPWDYLIINHHRLN